MPYPQTMKAVTVLLLVLGVSLADYVEIGEGGSVTTNRPFCGS